jgi:hypothetical protein
MKNVMIGLMLVPALAACKSAHMGDDASSDAAMAAEVPVVDADGRVRENVQDNEQDQDQVQGGS